MPPLFSLLLDPWTYPVLAGLGGLAAWFTRKAIASGVDHRFAVRLEDHKQSLQIAADAARYAFEHQLAQLNLYAIRRHGAALRVYRAIRVAHGHCMALQGLRFGLTFEEFNVADLVEHMTRYKVPKGKQEAILSAVHDDRKRGIKEMQDYLRLMQTQEAERRLSRAKNVMFLNELYFDDAVIQPVNELLEIMDRWMAFVHVPSDREERKQVPPRDEIHGKLNAVCDVLRLRLSSPRSEGVLGLPDKAG